MRNLSRVNPKGPKQTKGKTRDILLIHQEAIDEQSLLARIHDTFNKGQQIDQEVEENVLQTLFDADEILVTKRKSGTAQRVVSAIGDKILGQSLSFGANCAVQIATLRILSHLCAADEKWVLRMLQRNIDLTVLRALHVREVCAEERHESLRLISAMFATLSARSVAVLVGWWRFRLFASNVLLFLIGAAALGGGIASVEERNSSPKSGQQSLEEDKTPRAERKHFAIASGILLELLARFPPLFFGLGLRIDWLARLTHKCFETDNAHHLARIGAQLLANLLDCPDARRRGEMHLLVEQMFAPLMDRSILCSPSSSGALSQQQSFPENILRRKLQLCANCLADLLHTWPGFFVGFADANFRHSPCQSIISFLKNTSYLVEEQHEKLAGVEVFSRMLCLPYANKELATWDEAVQFYERVHGPDPYRTSLSEHFVLAELPFIRSLIKTEQTDLFKSYQSVRVYALCHSGLPEALIRTAVQNPDSPCAIKATLLLSDILQLSAESLPKEWRLKAHGIAALINRAAKAFKPTQFGGEIWDESLKYADQDWTNTDGNHSNAIKLYARLEQIERLRARSVDEKLLEMHTFLLPNLGADGAKGPRRRSSEHSAPSRRHSSRGSSSGRTTPAGGGGGVVETKNEMEGCLTLLDDLLSKAFVDVSNSLAPGVGIGIAPTLASAQCQSHNGADGHDKPSTVTAAPQWPVIWHILHTVGANLSGRTVDKCIKLFDHLVHHFLPSNRHFLCRDIDPLCVPCAQQCFRLLCRCAHSSASVGLDNSQWAAQQVASFLLNFCAQLQAMEQIESVFCSRFPLPHGARHYFAPLRAISAHPAGQKLLEQTALHQLLYDLALKPTTNNSLIKLIIASSDYFPDDGTDDDGHQQGTFARGLFEAVLLHSTLNEAIKKWATRFLDVFVTLERLGHLPTFPCWHWTLQLAFRQLTNPSLKIVRCAAKLLLNWLPKCPPEARKTALTLLKSSKLDQLGNLGMLLEVFLYGDWDEMSLCENEQLARKTLRAWKDQFNFCYLDIVEERIRKALSLNSAETFQQKRSMEGHFARASFDAENGKCRPCLFSPEHLYGQLIRTKSGQSLLQSECAVDALVQTLGSFLTGKHATTDLRQVKSSLFALAHLLANVDPFRAHLFSADGTACPLSSSSSSVWRRRFPIAVLVRLLCDCVRQQQSLCVRGFALWAANIAANGNGRVAELLTLSDWQCGESAESVNDLWPTKSPKNFSKMPKWDDDTNNAGECDQSKAFLAGEKQHLENNVLLAHRPRICTEFNRGVNARMSKTLSSSLFHSTSLTALPSNSQHLHAFVRDRQKSFDQLRLGEQTPRNVVGRWGESIAAKRAMECASSFSSAVNDSPTAEESDGQQQFMAEKEHVALIAYRTFLVTAGEINEYEVGTSSRKQSAKNCADFRVERTAAEGLRRGGIFLPKFSALFGQISLGSTDGQRISDHRQIKMRHNKWQCIFCAAANKQLQFRHEKCEGIAWTGAKFEAISLVDRLASAEIGTANSNRQMANLLRLFADDPTVFGDRCLFSDVLQILADSKTLSFDLRCTIYELFAHAF